MKFLAPIALGTLLLQAAGTSLAEPPGPHHFWTVYSGSWQVGDGKLSGEPNFSGESWIWAGARPIVTQADFTAELKMEFAGVPEGDVGRHGGIMFCASVPTYRLDYAMTGYTIDWIDREGDHGLRLLRWDYGNQVDLIIGTPGLVDPPLLWRVQVEGDLIRFYGDGELFFEFVDGTYRQGHFGIWTWENGTQLLADDVRVGRSFHDSFTSGLVTQPLPLPPHFWMSYSGAWQITDGKLSNDPDFWAESWIWAGAGPITTEGDFTVELKMEFGSSPDQDVGRHGGIMFCASVPAWRGDPAMTGYTIDWIDREGDHGLRLLRWDYGNQVDLSIAAQDLVDPPLLWRVQVEGDVIRFYGDGELFFEFVDGTYRQGHFGVWAWGNGTQVLVDDVKVGRSFHDSFTGQNLTKP